MGLGDRNEKMWGDCYFKQSRQTSQEGAGAMQLLGGRACLRKQPQGEAPEVAACLVYSNSKESRLCVLSGEGG